MGRRLLVWGGMGGDWWVRLYALILRDDVWVRLYAWIMRDDVLVRL